MAKVKINIGGVITEMEADEVSKAVEAGEVVIKDENLVVYEKAQFETFVTNKSNEEYKKGKTAGEEMLIKEGREKLGLEFQGKTFDNFAEAFKTKILEEAKVEPSKKIRELETEKETLQKNYQTLEEEFTGYKTSISEKETRQKKDNTLLSFIPTTGLIVDQDLALMALKSRSGVDITFDGNNSFVTKNGEIVKDSKTLVPVDPKEYVLNEITSLKLIQKTEGGAGGSDDPGKGTASNYDKFVKEMESQGVAEGSMKFGEEMNARLKAGTLRM